MPRKSFTVGINRVVHCYHSNVIITNGLSNNSSSCAPVLTWQRAELSSEDALGGPGALFSPPTWAKANLIRQEGPEDYSPPEH